MIVVICPHCQRETEIDPEIAARFMCPTCAQVFTFTVPPKLPPRAIPLDRPKFSPRAKAMMWNVAKPLLQIAAVIATMIGILILLFTWEVEKQAQRSEGPVPIRAKTSGTELILENTTSKRLWDVHVTVNGDYSYRVGTVDPWEMKWIGLMWLADSDGKRFQPFAMKPKEIMLEADRHTLEILYFR